MTCPDAFSCLNLIPRNEKVQISACCVMPTWEVDSVDFSNDQTLNKIRKEWKQGRWPSECNACYSAEKTGNRSRRHGALEWADNNGLTVDQYDEVKLLKLDYYTGNTCNLRCAICGPDHSIAWQKELGISKENRITNENLFEIDTDNIKWIHFNGGEPLLIDRHWELLKSVNHKNQVTLNYNTNATVLPKKELIELWSQFKLVVLDFSIDDIKSRFEYQRYPANWNRVVDNLFYLKEHLPVNVMFEVNTALGILNYHSYPDLQKWFSKNFATNRGTIPVKLKTQDTHGILSCQNKDKKQIVNYLNTLDARRNTDWKTTFPELVEKLL